MGRSPSLSIAKLSQKDASQIENNLVHDTSFSDPGLSGSQACVLNHYSILQLYGDIPPLTYQVPNTCIVSHWMAQSSINSDIANQNIQFSPFKDNLFHRFLAITFLNKSSNSPWYSKFPQTFPRDIFDNGKDRYLLSSTYQSKGTKRMSVYGVEEMVPLQCRITCKGW